MKDVQFNKFVDLEMHFRVDGPKWHTLTGLGSVNTFYSFLINSKINFHFFKDGSHL